METLELNARLRAIVGQVIDLPTPSAEGGFAGVPPFDISKPNFHDTKAEFLEEKRAVSQAEKDCERLFRFCAASYAADKESQRTTIAIVERIDDDLKRVAPHMTVTDLASLVAKNACDTGASRTLIPVLLYIMNALQERAKELARQERSFWSVQGRPPDYYARTIALRFAKLYARHHGKKPTFGTSRDGGHASTAFGRALEEIFKLLEITATTKHPAVWAIRQLTDDDLQRTPRNALAGIGELTPLMQMAFMPPAEPNITAPESTGRSTAKAWDREG